MTSERFRVVSCDVLKDMASKFTVSMERERKRKLSREDGEITAHEASKSERSRTKLTGSMSSSEMENLVDGMGKKSIAGNRDMRAD
jgi:hypothetical protein